MFESSHPDQIGKKASFLLKFEAFFISSNKVSNILAALCIIYGVLFLCSSCSKDEFYPRQQLFENFSFDQGLKFWEQDGVGVSWQPDQSSAKIEGFNLSRLLYQGQYGNGKYRLTINMTNNNPVVEDYANNGLVKVYQKNNGAYTFLKEGALIRSGSTVTQSFIIDLNDERNLNAIAVQVQRCGYGNALNMTIHSVQLIKLN